MPLTLTLARLYISTGESNDVSEKPWKPKEVKKTKEEQEIDTEWDDILQQATEDELVDLAGNDRA